MTTKIIITPANHGVNKGSQNVQRQRLITGGTARTVRVVTVGGSPNQPNNKTSYLTLPASALKHTNQNTVPVKGQREVHTMLKRVYTPSDNDVLMMAGSNATRKRQRLDHLTVDQKNQRRKLKNRVAAQTARDRKKMQMDGLEERVSALERENDKLQQQNEFLKKQNELLSTQNSLLQERLREQPGPQKAGSESPAVDGQRAASFESAEGAGRTRGRPAGAQSGQLGRLPNGAGDSSSQHADLLTLLTDSIFGGVQQSEEASASSPGAAVVGTKAEDVASGDDTLTSDADLLSAAVDAELEAAASYAASDELLARLLLDTDGDGEEAAVPTSPALFAAPPSPAHTAPASPPASDQAKVKTEHIDDWPIVFEEPLDDALDSHFDDQFILFPQLVM